MGWYFTRNATKTDILKEIVESWTWENKETGAQHRHIAHCCTGNTLWGVLETEDRDGTKARFIACYLLQNGGRNDGWGYKPMDEGMGPCQKNCPLKYLGMAQPEPTEGFAVEWRKEVRAYHGRTGRKLSVGQEVTLTNGWEGTVKSLKPLLGIFQGRTYRIPRRMLAA